MNFIKVNESFEINGNKIFCKYCNEAKDYNPSQGITTLKRHLTSAKHIKSMELKTFQTRLNIEKIDSDGNSTFHMELTEALISANIPINKLENSLFKSFLEKYTQKNKIPDILSSNYFR